MPLCDRAVRRARRDGETTAERGRKEAVHAVGTWSWGVKPGGEERDPLGAAGLAAIYGGLA
eukprot:gene6322-28782_t